MRRQDDDDTSAWHNETATWLPVGAHGWGRGKDGTDVAVEVTKSPEPILIPRGPRPPEGKFPAALRAVDRAAEREGQPLSRAERRARARQYRLPGSMVRGQR